MGTHCDYERRWPCRATVVTKGGQGMAAADYKQPDVSGCVPVKGVEGWRMPAWSAAVPPGTGGLAQRAAKVWPPTPERREGPRYVVLLDAD